MKTSLKEQVQRVLERTEMEHSDATLGRVGACIEQFLQAEAHGKQGIHPEICIADLPVSDHDAARACFDMLEILKSLDI